MKIGIIVAMGKELALMTPLLSSPSNITIDGINFHLGKIGKHDIVLLQCGIGKVNAALGAITMINQFKPELIINSGVAGGADKSVNVMDIIVGEKVAYHDVYCGPETQIGAVQGLPLFYLGAKEAIDKLPHHDNMKLGLIVSGDQFIDNIEKINEIKGNFPDAMAVDMESGAIAQICEIRKTPFISMRVISDSPGASHNNTLQYENFWEAAPQQTFEVVKQLLMNL